MLGFVTTLALSADKSGGAKNHKLCIIQTFPLLLIQVKAFLTTWEGVITRKSMLKAHDNNDVGSTMHV